MSNILFTNAGRRAALIKDFKKSLGDSCKIVATDNWSVAPALFFADKYYLTPKIDSPDYMDKIFEICEKENINAIATLIDPEIMLLAKHRDEFLKRGILPLVPSYESAKICFDKYEMFKYLKSKNIPTILTFDNLEDFKKALNNGEIYFPVFIKPKTGSGSVGARKISNIDELNMSVNLSNSDYVIQEFFEGKDIDIDVYIDTITKEVVSIFSKKKIETRIGGTSKSYSFKDKKLFEFVLDIIKAFDFISVIDIEVFFKDGKYYLSEINPRFSGAYLNAYGAGIDFPKMIDNNINGIKNITNIGEYEEDVMMLMYDEVVITKMQDLKGDWRD